MGNPSVTPSGDAAAHRGRRALLRHLDDRSGRAAVIKPLVEFMLAQPGMATRLVELHGPDRSGRCRGCRQYARMTPAHPCPIRVHADAAVDLLQRFRDVEPS